MDKFAIIPPNLIEQINTVRDYDISYDTLHPKAIIIDKESGRTIKVPYSAFTNKYKDALSKIIIEQELSIEEKRAFWYRPKSASLYYYETTELWADLLTINACVSIREFTPEVLKIYEPLELKRIVNEIMIIEGIY
jgi:hypothetical protein